MNLPVQHGSCLMLRGILCDYYKFFIFFISYRTYHVARTDVQPEYVLQLFVLLCVFFSVLPSGCSFHTSVSFIIQQLRQLQINLRNRSIIIYYYLTVSAILPFGQLRRKHLLYFFIRITAGLNQTLPAVFFCHIDIPQFVADLPVTVFDQQRRFQYDIICRAASAFFFHFL